MQTSLNYFYILLKEQTKKHTVTAPLPFPPKKDGSSNRIRILSILFTDVSPVSKPNVWHRQVLYLSLCLSTHMH